MPGTGASATDGAGAPGKRRVKLRAPRSLPNGDRSTGDGAPELGGDGTASSVGDDDWPTGDGELGGAGPGAAFECRLDRTSREGPLRVPCEVVARIGGAYDNGSAPFYYDIIANPMEAGTYDLRLLWMHSTQKEAFSPTSKPF